ncbi:MAG: LD-carboxypeptidase [Bacteroidales bacterium]|jgi:muramoyltetrapeptide carboxypeptidase|nr:LD-carboxypeptidase [Bacteroidales bacterium]
MAIIPKYLQPGDTIALASSAKKVDFQIVENARKHFESWGFQVIVGESAMASEHQFAGDDELRTKDFQTQLDNPNVNTIICLRGGYGSVRIIEYLDFSEFVKHPKWIVGYSDVTVIQNHILKNYNIASLHAEMPLKFPDFPNTNDSLGALKNALFGRIDPIRIQSNSLNKMGSAKGELVGGNLAILCSLLGSSSEMDTRGKILFLEDVGEYLYAIDRMMMTLKRAGKLDQLAGLAIGQFTDLKDNDIPFGKTVYEIIAEHVATYDYPVLFDVPTGHCEINKPLVFGGVYTMEITEESATLNIVV